MFGPYFGSKPPPLPTELSRARHRRTPINSVNSPQPSSNGEAACVDAHIHWTSFQPLIRLDSRPNPSARVPWVQILRSTFVFAPSKVGFWACLHSSSCYFYSCWHWLPSGKSSSLLQSSRRLVPTGQVGSVSCRKFCDSAAPSSAYVVEILHRHDLI